MKTRIPETIICINCNHNVIIKLYKVDTTVNSSQGHFHTIHNPGEPAYTVYCINCGHFMTNDPNQPTRTKKSSAKPTRKATGQPKAVVAPAGKKTIKPPTVTKASAAKAKPKTTQTTRTKTATRPAEKKSPRKKAK